MSLPHFSSIHNFADLLEPVFTGFEAPSVCEIGVDEGITTDWLLEILPKGFAYTGIDPGLGDSFVKERAGDRVRFLAKTSLDALPELERHDVYLVDGDHSYHTVTHELEAIFGLKVPPALVLLHDTAWPCARRDLYYAPDTLPEGAVHPLAADGVGPVPGPDGSDGKLARHGLHGPSFAVAAESGGGANGVLTAIEDFLAKRPDLTENGWRFLNIPAFLGLGLLYCPEGLPARARTALELVSTSVEVLRGTLSTLEEARLGEHFSFRENQLIAEELSGDYGRLKGEYDNLLERYRSLQGEYDALDGTFGQLKSEYAGFDKDYTKLEGTFSDLEKRFAELQQEYDTLKRSFADLQQTYQKLEAHSGSVETHSGGLQKSYDQLLQAYEDLRRHGQSLQAAMDRAASKGGSARPLMGGRYY